MGKGCSVILTLAPKEIGFVSEASYIDIWIGYQPYVGYQYMCLYILLHMFNIFLPVLQLKIILVFGIISLCFISTIKQNSRWNFMLAINICVCIFFYICSIYFCQCYNLTSF
ncbi:hypothetical protein HanRHA438_Chr06g0260611 [Helianthus annuus]|nr:hypothetical protein HanIR_Chr06g0270551 [Helianthus annuus]KAJ0911196.1 hypothetical protein HanRHA438_Chr06g0260611 [Helianthus annuus]